MKLASSTQNNERHDNSSSHPQFRWIQTLLLGVVVLAILLAVSDMSSLISIFSHMRFDFFFIALITSILSYLFITLSYRSLFNLLEYRIGFGELSTVTVTSTLINYFIATGGISGYALRAVMLKKRRIPGTITFSVSLVQGVLANLSVLVLIILSIVFLFQYHTVSQFQLLLLVVPVLCLIIFISLVLTLILNRRWSDFIFRSIERIIHWVEDRFTDSRKRWSSEFDKMKERFIDSIALFQSTLKSLLIPFLYVTIDWIFSMICLYISFRALNSTVSWTIVTSIYFVGIFISFAFLATGGLGIMEGGMAAVFVQFGVDWEVALAGVLLYRFIYYVFPLIVFIIPYILFIKKEHHSTMVTDTPR